SIGHAADQFPIHSGCHSVSTVEAGEGCLKVVWRQPGVFSNSGKHLRADFNVVVERPNKILVAGALQTDVGRTLECFTVQPRRRRALKTRLAFELGHLLTLKQSWWSFAQSFRF